MLRISLILIVFLAACTGGPAAQEGPPPTLTLASIVSMTPRFTATPVASRTPLPTFTFTPSPSPIPPTPSNTPTPTEVPPVIGIVASMNTVNVREGPGVSFSAIQALTPGTRLVVLGQDIDGTWFNVQMDNGSEGWIAASLLRLQETPTPIPTFTPAPDLTALAQGTPLPTTVLGGGTMTPTPPGSVVSPTPVTVTEPGTEATAEGDLPFLPVIDVTSINLTATALMGGGIVAPTATLPVVDSSPTQADAAVSVADATATLPSGIGSVGSASPQQGVDVLAYCDTPGFGRPAPTDLAAGSTIDIWWSWYAKTPQQIEDHLAHVIYEVAIDGVGLRDWANFRTTVRQQDDGNYYVYWYVPAGPLSAGPHEITYRVTWREAISDGYASFGPGTTNAVQTGSCTFTVQ